MHVLITSRPSHLIRMLSIRNQPLSHQQSQLEETQWLLASLSAVLSTSRLRRDSSSDRLTLMEMEVAQLSSRSRAAILYSRQERCPATSSLKSNTSPRNKSPSKSSSYRLRQGQTPDAGQTAMKKESSLNFMLYRCLTFHSRSLKHAEKA